MCWETERHGPLTIQPNFASTSALTTGLHIPFDPRNIIINFSHKKHRARTHIAGSQLASDWGSLNPIPGTRKRLRAVSL